MAILSNSALEGDRQPGPRLGWLDALRGVAVLAMVVYHTGWDLSDLALIELDVTDSTPWRWFARTIAATFLALAGIGLALAHRNGFRLRAFARRTLVLAAAALLVTVVTVFVFPDSFIFFGILHNMAVSSLVALPFLRWPPAAALVGAVLLWIGPLLHWPAVLDVAALRPLGLGETVPLTNDWVPVFPWTGFVLAGIAAARLGRLGERNGPDLGRIGRVLGAIGRRSLVIYLVHQALIFGALSGVRELVGPNPVAEAAPFVRQCTAQCEPLGPTAGECRAACTCTVGSLKEGGLWAKVIGNRLSEAELARARGMFTACLSTPRS